LIQNSEILFTLGEGIQIVGTPKERIRGDRVLYVFTLKGSKTSADIKYMLALKNRQYIVTYLSYQAKGEPVTQLIEFDADEVSK
jgi:hypothetical protein